MRWGALICVLAIGCGDAGALASATDDEPQRVHVDAGAMATESALTDADTEPDPVEHWGSHTPPMLPDCVGLLPSYVDRFGEYGLEAATQAVDEWLVATGHNPGDIQVVFDASCKITVEVGDILELSDDYRTRGAYWRGRILLNELVGMGKPCEKAEDRAGWETVRVVLPSLLKHELGHAFGCGHKSTGLMIDNGGYTCLNERPVDDVAVACAKVLTRVN